MTDIVVTYHADRIPPQEATRFKEEAMKSLIMTMIAGIFAYPVAMLSAKVLSATGATQ